jgi:hypothetical protein
MKTIVATYSTRDTAEQVINQLEHQGHARQDIGFAVAENTEIAGAQAMVTVTVNDTNMEMTKQILNQYQPVQLDEHDTQWRLKNEREGEHPNPDKFTAPELADDEHQQ